MQRRRAAAIAGCAGLALLVATWWGLASPPAAVQQSAASGASAQPRSAEQGRMQPAALTADAPERVELVATGVAGLSGVVLRGEAERVTGSRVELSTLDGRSIGAPCTTDALGRFAWRDLPQRVYRVSATLGAEYAETVAAAPSTGVELRLVAGATSSTALEVEVVDGAGAAVSDAAVEVAGDFTGGAPVTARTDAAGRAVFEGPRSRDAVVVARAPDGRTGFAVQWAANASSLVQVSIAAGGELRGSVRVVGDAVPLPAGAKMVASIGTATSVLTRG
jgi:hypothetical protein